MQKDAEDLVANIEAMVENGEVEELYKLREALRMKVDALTRERECLEKEFFKLKAKTPVALQLHLELDLGYFDAEHKEVLKKYGRMQESMSRDIIVPASMTLHALSYAIMKTFGWQNSHLHCFSPTEEEFDKMTGCRAKEWFRQLGVYFRFPSGDYTDIYWDDDYEEGENFNTWLKSKYKGPYEYRGVSEHYVYAQMEADAFLARYPNIINKSTDQMGWNVLLEGSCDELLEHNTIGQVLRAKGVGDNFKSWKEWRKKRDAILKEAEKGKASKRRKYIEFEHALDTLETEIASFECEPAEMTDEQKNRIATMFKINLGLARFLEENDPEVIPALTALIYKYDYGDGWEVKITCTNTWYNQGDSSAKGAKYTDADSELAEGDLAKIIDKVWRRERPVCIAWDGVNVLDDVGGIGGFCDFLQEINGPDQERKKELKSWARYLGWTGRMSKAENIL